MAAHSQLAALQTIGQIETCLHDIETLERHLEQVPRWEPATALKRQAIEARRMIAAMQARLDRRLVVTIIGPSGAGKSTLLNALAGVDGLSPVGIQRPTTRGLVVLANEPGVVRNLLEPWIDQADPDARIHSSEAAEALDHMILIDTPDTDSTQSDRHRELLHRAIEHSDVLLCVFDAQNPKRRDHADFMAPLVSRFHGASLVAVINKCDRLDPQELTEEIGPDFRKYLDQAWDTGPEALFMISARSHMRQPKWDPQAAPRHDLDQYVQLRDLIFSTFNRPGFVQDRRVANACQIRDFVLDQARRAAQKDRPSLEKAVQQISAAEQEALQQALASLRSDQRRQMLGVHVRLFQALSQRWLGPVGWMVAIWSRLIVFGSGMTALMRFGNPLYQIWGLVSSWKRFKESRSALAALNDQTRVDTALNAYRNVLLTHWPDVAEQLVNGRFEPQVRQFSYMAPENEQVGRTLENMWADCLDAEIERNAKSLSHPLLQIIFNLPSLALLGYVGWLTTVGFVGGQYLSSDFFLHAVLTIIIVMLLSFFLLQVLVRLATGRERIQRHAFRQVEQATAQRPLMTTSQVVDQAAAVFELARDAGASPERI